MSYEKPTSQFLRVLLDFNINSELLYSRDGKSAVCKVLSISFADKGAILIDMIHVESGRKFQRKGYELPKEFSLIKK